MTYHIIDNYLPSIIVNMTDLQQLLMFCVIVVYDIEKAMVEHEVGSSCGDFLIKEYVPGIRLSTYETISNW